MKSNAESRMQRMVTDEGRGFTLIELLVVIAIIALLMAILMPSLQKAKHQARRIACSAHLKSCGHAGVLYSNDNNGRFPYCHMEVSPGSGSYAVWVSNRQNDPETMGFMAHGLFFHRRLITVAELFYCPGNTNPTLQFGEPDPSSPGGGWPSNGRIPDDLGPQQRWVQTTYHYRSLWDEKMWRAVDSVKDGGGMAFMADVFSDPRRGVQYHHKNGYNVAYMDGHSEFVKDLQGEIQEFGGGATYHVDHSRQDYVWKKFFDRVMKYKPHREY